MLRWQAEDAGVRAPDPRGARGAARAVDARADAARPAPGCAWRSAPTGCAGELTLLQAARAYAAWRDDTALTREPPRGVAPMALRHRLRRDPLDEAGSGARVGRMVEEVLG